MRSRRGSKPLELPSMRELFASENTHAGIALVTKPDGSNDHYEIVDNGEDVIVSVQLMPSGQPGWGRLASFAGGGADLGIWRIPPVGAEVAVIYQDGSVDGEVLIIGTLSTGAVPSDLDADTLIIGNKKKVLIRSADDDIVINGGTAKVARVGDKTEGHTHTVTFSLTSVSGGAVSGTITLSNEQDTIHEGADHFKA